MDSVSHTWDANGNASINSAHRLLDDGTNTYTYDPANRLSTVNGTTEYAYNGLGDRLQQTIAATPTTYILDLNAGLTQVLDDGTNTYLYGNGRIAQVNTTTQYFLGDALGSVRQMTNPDGAVVLAKAYDPYGVDILNNGAASTSYGFTGEQTDPTGMVYLRARYYMPDAGRFMSMDTWGGDLNRPASYNLWLYSYSNPIMYTDTTGNFPCPNQSYNVDIVGDWPTLASDAVCSGVESVGTKLSSIVGGDSAWAFNRVYRKLIFDWDPKKCYLCRPLWCIQNLKYDGYVPGTQISCVPKGGATNTAYSITFATMFLAPDQLSYIALADAAKLRNNVVHELGHAFDHKTHDVASKILSDTQSNLASPCYIPGFPDRVDLPEGDELGPYFGFSSQQGVLMWQMNSSGKASEEFADMYLGWTFDKWGSGLDGTMRADWMTKYMPILIRLALSYE